MPRPTFVSGFFLAPHLEPAGAAGLPLQFMLMLFVGGLSGWPGITQRTNVQRLLMAKGKTTALASEIMWLKMTS